MTSDEGQSRITLYHWTVVAESVAVSGLRDSPPDQFSERWGVWFYRFENPSNWRVEESCGFSFFGTSHHLFYLN